MPQDDRPATGAPEWIGPGIVRLLAPNPSPMTHWGTNTYLLGTEALTVVDPGPSSAAHLDAIVAALGKRKVSHIVVTHSHIDHSGLAPQLAAMTGAPIIGFGPSGTGRSAVMMRLAADGLAAGGEGIDAAFRPDICVADGAVIDDGETALTVRHTPGHMGNHICLIHADAVFTGDHLMGWAPSLVSPPDGDLSDFMASCAGLREALPLGLRALPGHGAPVADAAARLDALMAHRRTREAQIRAALAQAPGTPHALALRIYTDTPQALLPAAARNVFAHLIDLVSRNIATCPPPLCATSIFSLS